MSPRGASPGAPFPAGGGEPPRRRRSALVLGLIVAIGLAVASGLAWLGVWQVQRLHWKEALIARVDARVHAAPVAAPAPAAWGRLTRENAEYLRIELTGRYLAGHDTFTRAATEQGPGWWVMTPFADARGFVVLVNRGFVPAKAAPPSPRTRAVGLLRFSEPRGGFLHRNVPLEDRWYSRDVAAIAARRSLTNVAPYFVDAERDPTDKTGPVGGLTVIQFPNNHLVYAITWFALAAMVLGLVFVILREERRR